MNVAILVGEFPNLSETFITDQIIGIMKLGHDVRILSSCRPQSTLLQPDVLTYSLLPKTTYLEESRPGRVGNAFGSLHNLAKIGVKSAKRIPKIVASCWPTRFCVSFATCREWPAFIVAGPTRGRHFTTYRPAPGSCTNRSTKCSRSIASHPEPCIFGASA